MGFLDKIFKSNFSEEDDEEYEEDENQAADNEDDELDVEPVNITHEAPQTNKTPAPAAKQTVPAQNTGKMKIDGASLELKLVKPVNYNVVSQIADHLLNRRTVVLNLEKTSPEDKRRIIDFLSGVAYSIDGHLSKVAINTFLIVPANVSISGVSFDDGADKGEEPKRVADIIDD